MNTTFTNYAEKKAKQFLNLLQGYTKGIRMTAILILLLMGVGNAWAATSTFYLAISQEKTINNNNQCNAQFNIKFGGGNNEWAGWTNMTKTDKTYNGKVLYEATFEFQYGGYHWWQFRMEENGNQHWYKEPYPSGSWNTDLHNNQIYDYENGTWVNYTYDDDRFVIVGNGMDGDNTWLKGKYWNNNTEDNIAQTTQTYSNCPAGLKVFRITNFNVWNQDHGFNQVTSCNVPYYTNEDNNVAFFTVAKANITIEFNGSNITVDVAYDQEDLTIVKEAILNGSKVMFYYGDEWGVSDYKYVNTNNTNTHLASEQKGFKVTINQNNKFLAIANLPAATYSISNSSDWSGVSTNQVVEAGAIYACYNDGGNKIRKTNGVLPRWTKDNATIAKGEVSSGLTATVNNSSLEREQTITYYYTQDDGNTWTQFDPNNVSSLAAGTYTVRALAHDGNIYVRTEQEATLTIEEDNKNEVEILAGDNGTVEPSGVQEVGKSGITVTATANSGYTFDEWIVEGGAEVSNVSEQRTTVTASSTGKVTATFRANTYSVKFNANGGSGTMTNQSFSYDETEKALTTNTFIRENHIFVGWATSEENANNGEVAYTDGQSVSNLTTTKDGVVDLYAVWATIEIIAHPEYIRTSDRLTLSISYTNIPHNWRYVVKIGTGIYTNFEVGLSTPITNGTGSSTYTAADQIPVNTNTVVVGLYADGDNLAQEPRLSASVTVICEYAREVGVFAYTEGVNSTTGGTINKESIQPSTNVPEEVVATPNTGYLFEKWYVIGGGNNIIFADATSPTTTVTATSNGQIYANFVEDLSSTWYIAGTTDNNSPFTGWAEGGKQMYKKKGQSDKQIYYCTFEVSTIATQDHHFEFPTYDSSTKKYYGYNNYWVTKENNSTSVYLDNSQNMKFRPYVAGTYEFKLDCTGTDPVLTVTWPVVNQIRFYSAQTGGSEVQVHDWDNTNANTWTKTITLNKGTHYFKVLEDSEFLGNTGTMTRNGTSVQSGGWSMSNVTENCGITADVAGDYVFKYDKTTNKLTVTYPSAHTLTYGIGSECNDWGTVVASPNIASGSIIADHQSITLTATAKLGYKFEGWYDEPTCINQINTTNPYTFDLTTNTTLYAKFVLRDLYIHADFVNNWGTPEQMTQDENNKAVYTYTTTLEPKAGSQTSPYNDGHHFHFVNTAADPNNNKAYNWLNVQTPTGTNIDGPHLTHTDNPTIQFGLARKSLVTITLTLQSPNDDPKPTVEINANPYYTITRSNPNNGNYTIKVGTNEAVSTNTESFADKTITLSATPNSGYHFVGWTVTKTGGETITVTGDKFTMPAEDVTVAATFAATTYNIIYNLNGGTNPNDAPTSYNVTTATFDLPTPTKTGYTFEGWYTASDFSGNKVTQIANGSTGDITLYAKWTEITYAVIINAVGNGTVSPSGEQQVGAGGLSVTATPDAGYIVKWNTTGGAMVSSTTDNEITVTANAVGTVTANFEESPLDTIYFVNDKGWTDIKVHLWGGTAAGTTWPGIAATKADFQLHCCDVYYVTALPGSYANCIFSDNGDNNKKTADLTWTAGKYFYDEEWKTLDELTYEVQLAGSMLINNGNWVLQDMTVDAYNSTGSITVSLEANTTYEFKIIVNDAWHGNTGTMTYGNSTGWTMSSSEGTNCKIKTAEAGNYIFTYDVCTAKLTVTYPAAFVTVSDGVSEAVSSSQTQSTLTSVPGQMVTATPTMGIGANGNTLCWKLYDKDQDIDNLKTTVDVNFISLGNGKITFELPKVTGTYYLQLTTHTGADCSDETLLETIICPINVSTENTVFFQDESGTWKNVYVYFYGSDGYWGTGDDWDKGSGAKEVNSYKMTKINGTNIFYYNYRAITTHNVIAFTDHNQGKGQGDDGNGYQWFSSCQVVYRSDFASCAPMFVLDKKHGVHHNTTAYYYTDGYWTTYMGTSSGYKLHISGNGVTDPNHEMTTTTVGKRVYTHTVSLNGNQTTPYELWFEGCNGTYYGVESNMTVTNCTEWNLYSGSASVNLYATAAGDYTFILYCNPDGHFQLSVAFPVAEGDYQLVYDDEQQDPHPSDYIRSSTVDGKLDTVSMYIRGKKGTNKTLKVQRCTGFNEGNPQWTTLETYYDAHFSGLNLTKDTVYNFHMEQTVSNQTIDIKSTEFYSGKYYVRTKAADGGWDAYTTEADNQMTYTEYSSYLPFDPYTHYFCKWVDDSNKDDVSYTIACDYAKALSDTLEGDNYTTTPESHALPEKANVRFTYDNRTNGLKRAYLTGASDSDFDDFLKLTKTKDGTTMKPGQDASDVSHVKLQDEENWVYATEIYVTSAESDGGGYSFDAMLTAVYPKSAVNDPAKKQYFFAKKNDNGTYAGETLIGGTDDSEQLVTIRYDFKTNRLMRAWKPSGEIDDGELPLSADILLIREGQNAAEQLKFTDPAANKMITNVKTIFGALEFKYDNMVGQLGTGDWNHTSYHYCRYYVSFPFDVRISEIFGAGNYGEDYIIQKYNGTKRAEIGWFAETETFWETMDKSEKLNKYEGYCVMLNRTPFNDGNSHVWKNKKAGSSVYLYFPSASHKDDWTINAIGDVVIPIPEHKCNIDRDFTQDVRDGKNPPRNHQNTDSHWNMVGTPLFQNATAAKIADGPEVEEGDGHAEQGTRLQYVYDWVNTVETPNGTAARKAWGTDFEFKAMHSYLIQYAGEVTFRGSHIANHVPASVAARRAAEEVKNYTVELQLDRDSAFASRTYVELQENAEDGFLLNEDMYMGSSSPIANLYTYAGAYDVAANVLSVNNHIVPVGVQVKKAGTYTFSMTTPFDGTVTLIDYHTGSRTNLGWSDYTVTLEKGTINDRFALEINIQNVSTDVEGNTGHFKGKDAVKFLHNGILYIKKGDAIYDARGSRVSMSYEL